MYIDIDYNPAPSSTFFISAGINDREAISFDFTTKGQRITKQKLIAKKENIGNVSLEKPTSEWDVIELKDTQFIKKRHEVWIDKGDIDEVNGEVWSTQWSKPMTDAIKEKLLFYSQLISDHYQELDNYKDEMREFELYMKDLVEQFNR